MWGIPPGYRHILRDSPTGLKTVHRTVFPRLCRVTPFESHLSHAKIPRPKAWGFWCERWDSNPHGITTRTSNVLVYHSNTLA